MSRIARDRPFTEVHRLARAQIPGTSQENDWQHSWTGRAEGGELSVVTRVLNCGVLLLVSVRIMDSGKE